MRYIIIFLLLIFTSCFNDSNKEVKSTESKITIEENEDIRKIRSVERELNRNQEKILLLSLIKKNSYEKTYSVLKEYHFKTNTNTLFRSNSKESSDYLLTIIDTIAINNNLSKKEVASIIFSYKYELMTPEDIYDKYSDEIIESYLDEIEGF